MDCEPGMQRTQWSRVMLVITLVPSGQAYLSSLERLSLSEAMALSRAYVHMTGRDYTTLTMRRGRNVNLPTAQCNIWTEIKIKTLSINTVTPYGQCKYFMQLIVSPHRLSVHEFETNWLFFNVCNYKLWSHSWFILLFSESRLNMAIRCSLSILW